jgi:hypothetical protein
MRLKRVQLGEKLGVRGRWGQVVLGEDRLVVDDAFLGLAGDDAVGLSGSGWIGGNQLTMSALLASTSVSSIVRYGPLMFAAVCNWTVTFGYFFSKASSIALSALTAGGLSQVRIVRVPDAVDDEELLPLPPPEAQAVAVSSAAAPRTEPARSRLVRR